MPYIGAILGAIYRAYVGVGGLCTGHIYRAMHGARLRIGRTTHARTHAGLYTGRTIYALTLTSTATRTTAHARHARTHTLAHSSCSRALIRAQLTLVDTRTTTRLGAKQLKERKYETQRDTKVCYNARVDKMKRREAEARLPGVRAFTEDEKEGQLLNSGAVLLCVREGLRSVEREA